MDSTALQFGILLWLLLLGALILRSVSPVMGPQMGAWMVGTALALFAEFVAAFIVLHFLLFSVGTAVAGAGLLITAAVMIATPFAVAVGVRRWAHRPTVHG